jgi:hypothetical protein
MQVVLAIAVLLLLPTMLPAIADVVLSLPSTVDEKGMLVQEVAVGNAISIQSILTSSEPERPFVYIVQVQDGEGYVVSLSLINGTLHSGNQTLRTSWTPEKEGAHTVQTFVWSEIESPVSLAMQKSSIDVTARTAHCLGDAACFKGLVTRIIDGDTLVVGNVTIRLALVNTPERGQAGYSEATEFTAALCPIGSAALVDEDDGQTRGSYGRMVAKVYCGDNSLNEELLRAGHATIYGTFCNVSEFAGEDWASKYGC